MPFNKTHLLAQWVITAQDDQQLLHDRSREEEGDAPRGWVDRCGFVQPDLNVGVFGIALQAFLSIFSQRRWQACPRYDGMEQLARMAQRTKAFFGGRHKVTL